MLYDEADVDGHADRERIQGILALARAASYSDSGSIAKGTQSGSARVYITRSCFAFSSIGVQLNQQSDRSRFSTLALKKFETEQVGDNFGEFWRKWDEAINDDFVQNLQARTASLIPVILKNAKTFAKAASHETKSQRTGDQVGAMLAGVYSLTTSKLITYDEAVDWVKSKDWSEEKGMELTTDELQLFALFCGQLLKVEGEFRQIERSVGELILMAGGILTDWKVSVEIATQSLKRFGVLVLDGRVLISNNSTNVKKGLANTGWSSNHGKIFLRLEGAEKVSARGYDAGPKSRGVSLPIELFSDGYDTTERVEPVKPQSGNQWPGGGSTDTAKGDGSDELPF